MLYLDAEGRVSNSPPMISFLDHGFLFGDSLYEVVRVYDKKILGWNEHMDRLQYGGKRLGISIEDLLPEIKSRSQKLLKALNEPNASLRMIITRGVGKLNIDPRTCDAPTIVMAAWPFDLAPFLIPPRLFISKIRRNHVETMDPAIKSGNYLNNVLAFKEAVDAGYDDAILLNPHGYITELTTSNLGWVNAKGEVITSCTDSGILHGITRKFLGEICDLKQGHFFESELKEASEVFVLSTFKEVLSASEIKFSDSQTKTYAEGVHTQKLKKDLRALIQKKLSQESAWF